MKAIHFIIDDKFLNGAISFLNEISILDNEFYVITTSEKFRFLKPEFVHSITYDEAYRLVTDPTACDIIVIHGLKALPCRLIRIIDYRIKVIWLSWGYDLYYRLYPYFPLIKLNESIKPGTLDTINKVVYNSSELFLKFCKFVGLYRQEYKSFIPAINRIDYCSCVLPIEYESLKLNDFFKAKPFYYKYISRNITKIYNEDALFENVMPRGSNIQIGNSAAIWNNHRNVFHKLSLLELWGRKIITPLSYGGNSFYISSVCSLGCSLWGDNFVPIKKFMPYLDYVQNMNSISIAIYNIERQSAIGNIKMNLWNGAKVFLPEKSMNLKYFKELGVHVFSIEKDLNQQNLDKVLTWEQIIENRRIVLKVSSYERIKEKIATCFIDVCANNKQANVF